MFRSWIVRKSIMALELDYVGAAQNEKWMKPEWVTEVLRPTLDKAGYGKVKLQGPDTNGVLLEDLR